MKSVYYVQNNIRKISVVVLFFATCTGCFVWRFSMYAWGKPFAVNWHQRRVLYGWSLPIAKGFGQVNKVCFAFILLPVSRNTMTYLRSTKLYWIIPFDESIAFHKMIGITGLISVCGHTIAHINGLY